MDHFISSFDGIDDADLRICHAHGVAFQRDMSTGRVRYDTDYLAKVDAYEGTPIAQAVNAGRCALLMRHLPAGATVLDIGAGSGAFVRAAMSWGFAARGYDVIPAAQERLRAAGLYADDLADADAVTLWDTLEHMEEPGFLLNRIPVGSFLFVSVPIFEDLRAIRNSRHYRPGEHLYHFTVSGLVVWMSRWGFDLLERSDHETAAGRDSIGAFAFRRERLALQWG